MNLEKNCTHCKTLKHINFFYKNRHEKDGYTHRCKDCCKEFYLQNKEKYSESIRKYNEKKKITYTLNCPTCLTDFKTRKSNAKCCSKICYKAYYNSSELGKLSTHKYNQSKIRTLEFRFASSKSKAKQKDMSWNIDFESYKFLQQSGCFYCDEYLLNKTSIGLDRIDNSLGYELLNVLPCCGDCNKVRQDKLTVFEMIHVARLLKQLRSGTIFL